MSTAIANGRGLPAVMQPDQIDYGPERGGEVVVRYTMNDLELMAKRAAASRMFNLDENQAFTLMLICEAEGLHPIQALRRYHCIQGRPAMRADAILAEMIRHGWSIEWLSDSRDRVQQEARFTHARKCPNGKAVAFTMEDAKAAGLAGKDNWRNHPPAMLRARVSSTACRMLDPGIIAGIYTPEEVEDMLPVAATAIASRDPRSSARAAIRDALESARRPSPSPASAVEAPAPEKPRTEFGAWLDARLADVHQQWSEIAKGAGADPGKPITRQQVVNHLIKAWIGSGMLIKDEVETDGRRDKNKVAIQLSAAWDEDAEELKSEVDEYLRRETLEAAKAVGLTLPDDSREPETTPGAAPPEDEAGWDHDRE